MGWPVYWSVVAVALAVAAITDRFGLMAGLIAAAAFSLFAGWRLIAATTSQIQELGRVIDRVAEADFEQRIYTDGRGEFSRLTRSINDMSERLAARFNNLQAESQQFRMILAGMVEGVVAIDGDQRIIFANERAVQLLNLPRPVANRPIWEAVRIRGIRELVERAMVEASPCLGEFDLPAPAPSHVMAHVARLPGTPGRGAVMVLHDLTEMRRLERIRQEFVANVSHELKTPLAIISACTETLQAGAIDDLESRDAFLSRIAEQSQRLHDLILDLLSLARIESNELPLDMAAVDIRRVVEACVQRHQERANRQQIQLSMASTIGASAWADEEALRQILDNLIDNALKYTPQGGRIETQWRVEEDSVVLEVRDTGVGIPEADVPRIFERFYRVDKNRSRELGGTGLGLSIVKHLVQAMKGSVTAASQVGAGTTITIRLRGAKNSPSLHSPPP